MVTAVIFSCILGFVLGRRFKFFVLIPAFLIIQAFIIGMGVVGEYDAWIIVVAAIVAAFALEVGYLVGAHYRTKQAGRDALVASEVLRPPFGSSRGAPTPNLS